MSAIHDLEPGRARADATAFLARWIEDVVRSRVLDADEDPAARKVRTICEHWRDRRNMPAPLPQPARDHWRGFTEDGRLAAVVHAGPHWGQALGVVAENPARLVWASRYLAKCWNVEEMAVHPEHRRKGHGRALIEDVEAAARSHGVRTLTAYAGSDEAVATFAAAGWETLPPRTPIPAHLAEGLRTSWGAQYNDRGGAWTFRTLEG